MSCKDHILEIGIYEIVKLRLYLYDRCVVPKFLLTNRRVKITIEKHSYLDVSRIVESYFFFFFKLQGSNVNLEMSRNIECLNI